jgi:hypothetical protein
MPVILILFLQKILQLNQILAEVKALPYVELNVTDVSLSFLEFEGKLLLSVAWTDIEES